MGKGRDLNRIGKACPLIIADVVYLDVPGHQSDDLVEFMVSERACAGFNKFTNHSFHPS